MPRRVIAPGRSCLECRRRKIKCDRSSPCSYCLKLKITCHYPLSRTKRSGLSTVSDNGAPSDETQGEVAQEDSPNQPVPTTIASTLDSPSSSYALPFSCLPFGSAELPPLAPLHPSTASKLVLWQTYIDVVDPTLKLFHIPTAQRDFIKAVQETSTIEPDMECLMFAVYYSVIAAMPASACLSAFNEDKADLIRRYRLGVETALLKARFLQSSDIKVLQALVIYLTFVRNSDDQPDIQSLMSIAVGNAMRMGLNCEAAMLHVSIFEAEMYRRLWWQVYILDVRTSMECGVEPSIREQTINAKKPRNVNDVALHPDMTVLPDSQDEKTEMTLVLVRIQGSELTRRTIFSEIFNNANGYTTLTREEKCQKLDEFKQAAEMQYLICNPSQIPLDVIASATAKLIVAKLKVMVCQPQTTEAAESPLRDNYKVLCLDVLEESHKVRGYKPGRPWSWLFEACVEWDALAYILLDLCVTSSPESSEEYFHIVDQVCTEWQGDLDLIGDKRWQHIEALWLEVKSIRA